MKELNLPTKKLKELGVIAVYLFGSQAEGASRKTSDYDVAVFLDDPKKAYGNTDEIYGKLYDIFSNAFDLSGFKNIDIVFAQKAPLYLQYKILTTGKILYQDKPKENLRYKEKIMLKYADFAPIRKEFNRAILSTI